NGLVARRCQKSHLLRSILNDRDRFDLIGMTNAPEAKLAREAEIALATLGMITDYDCWKIEEEAVSAEAVIGHVVANAETAKSVLEKAIPIIPAVADWPEHKSLEGAIVTSPDIWPEATAQDLSPIVGRFVSQT
ncbi:MAG: S-methyl-5'-thioadenosine phosphorylase, partial [Verrucomicrobiota bacterium]